MRLHDTRIVRSYRVTCFYAILKRMNEDKIKES